MQSILNPIITVSLQEEGGVMRLEVILGRFSFRLLQMFLLNTIGIFWLLLGTDSTMVVVHARYHPFWITGDRLKTLNLLPLSYDRETKDLTYFFKLLDGFYDLNVSNFVSFVSHNPARNCKNPSLVLKVPSCKTSSFQSSFFNRIGPLWNYVCKIACPADLRSLTMVKSFLSKTYVQLLVSSFINVVVFISKLFVSQIILGKHMPFACERIFLSWFLFFELAWAVLRLLAST